MFGDKFWDNVILEATHWKYTRGGIRERLINGVTEESWTKKCNDEVKEIEELNLGENLDSVFINTHYDATDPFCESAPNTPCTIDPAKSNYPTSATINTKYYSKHKFHEQTKKLIDWAKQQTPFHCKDIKIAQTEIDELTGELNSLKQNQSSLQDQINKLNDQIKAVCACIKYYWKTSNHNIFIELSYLKFKRYF